MPDVRAVVLTHTGNTFCAGADLSEASTGPMTGTASALLVLLRTVVDLPLPVIASIDGNVRAGGVGLLGACDIVLAGPRSTFAITEARLGLAAAVDLRRRVLPRLNSRSAAQYFLTGATSTPPRRSASALSPRPPTTLAVRWLRSAAGSPQGVTAGTHRVQSASPTVPVQEAIERYGDDMVELSARLFASEEAHEGMTAFLERRPPRWTI